MWSVQKKVTALLVVAVMVTVVLTTKSDKLRFKVKHISTCSPGLNLNPIDIKTSYKQKGKILVVSTNLEVKEDTEGKTYNIQIFKDKIPPFKLVNFEGSDLCAKVMEGKTVYLEPPFAAGQIPRNCTIKKGVYPMKVDVDLVFDGGNLPDSAKGRYNYKYEYGDGTKDILCLMGYGDLEKE